MAGSPAPTLPPVQLRVLGPLELTVAGRPVPIRRGRPRRLLLALLLRAGQGATTDTLVDELWADEPPRNAANALQILVSYLRKVLAAAGDDAPRIDTLENGYRLLIDPAHVDAFMFEDAVRGLADIERPSDRLHAADAALALWRGEPLAEAAYESFAQADIRRLRELRVTAAEVRVQALLDLGRHAEAISELQGLVTEHPLHERFHGQLMLALYRSGRQAEALRAYDAARSTLVDELGLDPGPELQALSHAVLEQSPSLDWTAPDDAAPTTPAASAAPSPAPSAPAPALPTPAGALVGREADVAHVRCLLDDRPVVTITGPGGGGKTRLALAVVEGAAHDVWWADLAGASSEEDVLAAVAAAVGAPTQPDDTGEGITSHLARRSGTLVLDTCEHVVAAVRRVVGRLRRECPDVVILATSRQPLRVPDELAWPVPPLSLPPAVDATCEEIGASAAVQLFVERAAVVRPGFELTPDNAADISRVVLLVDGLPLAIELAAANADAVTPAKIVDLLADRLRILVDDQRVDRQHALRATIDWSYDLLDADEARFFERLSVFVGTFPLEAAVSVAGDGLARDGFELLIALTRQSLVVAGGDDRFRLLDTVRAYAGERLAARGPDEVGAARRRHAGWYADLAGEGDRHLRGPDATGWVVELRGDLPNLRAALEFSFDNGDPLTGARLAAALSWFWAIEGLFGEAARWLSAARGVVAPDSVLAADVLASAGTHASSLGRLADAVESFATACKLYEQAGQQAPLARSLTMMSVAQWGLGAYADAAAGADQAIELFRKLDDDWGLGLAMVLRARTAGDEGDDALATRLLNAALPVVRRGGDPHIVALALEQRARVAVRDGDAGLGASLAAEAVELDEGIGYVEGTVAGLHALGLALTLAGDVDAAQAHHARALRLAVELDHPGGIAEGLECLAVVAARRGDTADAARLLGAADAVRERADLPRLRTHAVTVQPAVDAAASLDDAARRSAETAGRLLDVARLAAEVTAADRR